MHRILLIEDDPLDARQLQMALDRAPQNERFELRVAGTLAAGIAALGEEAFALIALDLSLPDASGPETFERVHAEAEEVPVVIMTGREDDDLAIQLLNQGAQDYLVKSHVAPKDVVRCFLYAISRSDAERATIEARRAEARANEARATFLASMSHEIRTPLNAVLGMAELLRDTGLSTEQSDYLKILGRAGQGLKHLIDNVLEIAKLDAGGRELEQTELDLGALVSDAVQIFGFEAHRKSIAIVGQVDPALPIVEADMVRLRQILVNLIGNAVKFTASGGVEVSASWDETRNEATIRVRDTGPGVPPERLEAIFEPFTQGSAEVSGKHGGTGLGLTISRRLAEAMDGRLSAANWENGAEFVLSLPLRAVRSSEQPDFPDLAGKRILLAEASDLERNLHARWLEEAGAVVEPVSTTSAADSALARCSFDAVVVDARMPIVGGLHWLDDRRQQAPPLRIAMLMMDHRTSDHEVCRTLSTTPMLKPLRRESLLSVLSGLPDPAAATARPPAERRASLDSIRVLLAEDGPDNQVVVRGFLAGSGAELTVVEDGAAAVEAADSGAFDLVLMDLSMPVMGGEAATREIRARERLKGRSPAPILALTAHTTQEAAARAREAGCDDVVTKPFDRGQLCRAIETWAGKLAKQQDAGEAGDPDDLSEFLPEYWGNRRKDLQKLGQALEEEDFRLIERIGHQMKGSGGCYGLPHVSELGAYLERAAAARDRAKSVALVEQLQDLVDDEAIPQSSATRSL